MTKIRLLWGTSGLVTSVACVALLLAPSQSAWAKPKKKAPKAETTPVAAEATPPPPAETIPPPPVVTGDNVDTTPAPGPGDASPLTPTEQRKANEGFFGFLRVGPSITLASFPHPFGLGLETKLTKLFGVSLHYGFFPTISISSTSVGYNSLNLRAKVFPFSGSFFLGLTYGKQNVSASQTDTATGIKLTGTFATGYVTPHLGWRWVSDSGFMAGMEFGLQLAQGTTVSVETEGAPAGSNTIVENQLRAEIDDAADVFNVTLPHITLLHFGWMF